MIATKPKISLSLDAAYTTIMHRVGMAGLYMTLKQLEKQYPSSRQRGGHISWFLTADTILFVPVVCYYCLLHIPSEDLKEKKPHRYLVVIPEIKDFEDASQRRWRLQQLEIKQLHVTSLGEAGLLYYSLDDIQPEGHYYQVCQVWLYERMNQTSHQRTLMRIEEIKIDKNTVINYHQVQKYFPTNYQKIKPKRIFIKVNPIRSLIADNLAKEMYGFQEL